MKNKAAGGPTPAEERTAFRNKPLLIAAGLPALFFLLERVVRIDGLIWGPHEWRQTETAFMMEEYVRSGIDLLYPSVSWLGNYKTTLWEFPLPEAFISLFYRLPIDDIVTAKAIFLLFFLAGVPYLYLLAERFAGSGVALLAVCFFLISPIAVFFSLSLQVDFYTVTCMLGFFYHTANGLARERDAEKGRQFLAAGLFFGLGCMEKAPYMVAVALPLLAVWWPSRSWKNTWMPVALCVPGLVGFAWWVHYSNVVNGALPAWDFAPGFVRVVNMYPHYFGTPEQRKVGDLYFILLERLYNLCTLPGTYLLAGGIVLLLALKPKDYGVLLLWALGSVAYTLICFNVNVEHNYYQTPLVPILAILMAYPVWLLWQKAPYLAVLALLLTGWDSHARLQKEFFWLNEYPRVAGKLVDENVPKGDAVIVSSWDNTFATPVYTYYTRRPAFNLRRDLITYEALQGYKSLGARWIAIIDEPGDVSPKARQAMGQVKRLHMFSGSYLTLYPIR